MKKIDYQFLKKEYSPQKIFDTVNIKICVTDTQYDSNSIYVIKKISPSHNAETQLAKEIEKKLSTTINNMKYNIGISSSRKSWSVFYTFKELVDSIDEISNDKVCYYRGQSRDWPLAPNIFRDGEKGFTDEFRKSYEEIFKDIKRRYPHQFKTVSRGGKDEERLDRATELSILQHYGFGTPLLDITENPFVAMLFMTHNYNAFANSFKPQLDVFFVNRDGDHKLFQPVRIEDENPRIVAQQGAFLDFDYIPTEREEVFKKVEHVCISVDYKKDPRNEKDRRSEIMQDVGKEFVEKLATFHYRYEDLFPDFSNYVLYLKENYQGKSKDVFSEKAKYGLVSS